MTTSIVRTVQAITIPEEIGVIREQWVESKREELERARVATAQLREAGATTARLRRSEERVTLLRKVVRALDAGFIPIPRFDSSKLRLDLEELPLKVIMRVNEVVAQKVFDELRLVSGQVSQGRRGRYGRQPVRDPLVVGVVRTPEVREDRNGWSQVVVPGREEHFLIAWWRPEDERDEDMF